jgi:hypothetical protein
MITRDDLIGSWRLETWELIGPDGAARRPFGDAPPGLLVYTPDGTMAVAIMRGGRPRTSRDDLGACPVEEQAAAGSGYFSYTGPFDVAAGSVFHRVAIALDPNRVGTVQERRAQLDGDLLVLTSPPTDGTVSRIRWRRVGA